MSMFYMPKKVSALISSLISRFIWGSLEKKAIHWVSWETMCLPKKCGGLGLIDLRIKNQALLLKWIWRYSFEPDSLWRKVIASKYEKEQELLLPKNLEKNRKSFIWRNITSAFLEEISKFYQHVRLLVGDGKKVDFWNDTWICDQPLKLKFPRMFALSEKKSGCVAEFGFSSTTGWQWDIKMRRELFEWEKGIWEAFRETLEVCKLKPDMPDSVRWEPSSNGVYSTKGWCEVNQTPRNNFEGLWDLVWTCKAPPKVVCFVWKALLGRIPTTVELKKRGCNLDSIICKCCNADEETVEHLLCSCYFAWRIWQRWLNLWNLQIVFPRSYTDLFKTWTASTPRRFDTGIWRMLFFCCSWTIWLARNELVFNKTKLSVENSFYLCTLILGWWCKALFPENVTDLNDLMNYPARFQEIGVQKAKICSDSWMPPEQGKLKFNIDGAVRGSFGEASIGGILRNEEEKTLVSFSKNVGRLDATSAEISAVKEALFICKSTIWVKSAHITIECDCSLAIEWLQNPWKCPHSFKGLVKACLQCGEGLKWNIQYAPREANVSADLLAKKGIGRKVNSLWFAGT